MDRREFVLSTAVATLTGGSFGSAARMERVRLQGQQGRLPRIGVQLYTVRDLMRDDVARTLAAVSQVGYNEVEFAGYFGHDPADVRALLERNGLRSPAAHVGLEAFREDRQGTIARGLEVGHEYLVVPSISRSERSIDGYRRIAEEFNEIGRACREHGMRFGYHNHDFEFATTQDRIPFDILLEECQSDLVCFELDLYWIREGGQDALQYFERFPHRFELCHVKDMSRDRKMVDVGDGVINFGAIFARAAQAGLKHYFVEHDNPVDALESIRKSYQFLEALRF